MQWMLLAGLSWACAAAPAVEISAEIDRQVAARWTVAQVQPAPVADDAEFLRRVSLDLVGQIPTAADVRAFLADSAADKRHKTVERLTASPAFARHRARQWSSDWIPQASPSIAEPFTRWLEARIRRGAKYDQIVNTLLTTAPRNEPTASSDASEALGFLLANDFKPENLAANSARLFLGLNLECAQCHDHPFARWTNVQFWEFAAFFSNVQSPRQIDRPQIELPMGGKLVSARFPDGQEGAWLPTSGPRGNLMKWMEGRENRYFARNAVNRMWADLMGVGLVEPLDDLSGAVEPSHPQLLDYLATVLVESGYEFRLLVKAIVGSRTYQLTSGTAGLADDLEPQLFAHMPLRPLSAQQLLDSLTRATGVTELADDDRHELLEQFRLVDRRAEQETSILQTLLRMNGHIVEQATDPAGRGTLAAASAPLLDDEERIAALYLATVSRPPDEEELNRAKAHLAGNADRESALADLLWVLLNSAEFAVNH